MCHDKSFYDRRISPRLVHCGCSADEFSQMRERIIPRAKGIVVEIGFGSGLNLPHYDPRKVDLLIGVEPDAAMLALANEPLAKIPFPAELHQAAAEQLPLKDATADTVVVTYALCSIADPARALAEIKRILKPSGKLLFCEHALATGWRARLQNHLDSMWRKLFAASRAIRSSRSRPRASALKTLQQNRSRSRRCCSARITPAKRACGHALRKHRCASGGRRSKITRCSRREFRRRLS